MKYNPGKHHRRSLRLKGYDYSSPGAYFITICTHQRECLFGEIVDGEMQLNPLGHVVRSHWLKLQTYHSHLQLDAWVVMPNHVHAILIVTHGEVGAGLAENISVEPINLISKPTPTGHHGIPEIIRGFKTFSARRINEIRKIRRVPVWQRNYYEHIIRNEESLQHIRQYVQDNAIAWQHDQLHPDNPSKW